ncbi:MAG TPA: TolC family protein [Stellaceae bacterium]|nr:TolC family protein [Stellaceae bacterium]
MTRRPRAPAATGRRPGHSPGRLLPLGLIFLLAAGPAAAENAPDALPGATLDTVLAIARRLSPELATRALETEAAQARVDIAGSWDDPTLRVTSDEIDRTTGPRQNKMIYSVEQEIPLWGKRDLRRDAARAEADQMAAEGRSAEADLIEKVKVAFAQYYQTDQAIRTTHDLHGVVHDIATLARDRYTQNRGTQQEIFKAEVESARIEIEIARLEASSRAAKGRLNALLARPIDAPLAKPARSRHLPPGGTLVPAALLERARVANPGLQSSSAIIAGAESNRRLAEKSWYPDITISASAIDRTGNGPNGYMAAIGLKVPLQFGLHSAQEHEATAKFGAARARRQVLEQQIEGDLAEAVASLSSSHATADLIGTQLLPKSEALVRSGVAAYAAGRAQLTDVLMAEHDLADLRVQLLSAEFDTQRQLAAIERLIGGDL